MRKTVRAAALVAAIFLISSCHITNKINDNGMSKIKPYEYRNWEMITGNWYEKTKTVQNETREALVIRKADGTYEAFFKTTGPDGEVSTFRETGTWGLTRRSYYTIVNSTVDGVFRKIETSSPFYCDLYKVSKIDKKRFTYRHVRTKDKFSTLKVDSSFIALTL